MVTLHFLEYLKNQGFGTAIDTDLFFEKLPLDKTGVAIYSVGGERPYGARSTSQLIELECRGQSDLLGMNALEKIAQHLQHEFAICDLPTIPGVSNRLYSRCRVVDVTGIQNIGFDPNDRVIFKVGARLIYQKQST